MKDKTKKKSLLAIGTALIAPAAVQLTNGHVIQGGLLMALAVGCIGAYDYYDDRMKGKPSLPQGIDENTLIELSEIGSEAIKDLVDRNTNDS